MTAPEFLALGVVMTPSKTAVDGMNAIEKVFEHINHASMFIFGKEIDYRKRITTMLKDGGTSESRIELDWKARDDTKLKYVGVCNKHLLDS